MLNKQLKQLNPFLENFIDMTQHQQFYKHFGKQGDIVNGLMMKVLFFISELMSKTNKINQ